VSAPGTIGSSTALSWPHGTEFVDSYLKLTASSNLSFYLWCDDPYFCQLFEDVPFDVLQQLADVDYRKSLIADRMCWDLSDTSDAFVLGIWATVQTLSHTVFKCIRTEYFDELVSAAFLLVCFKYDYSQSIYPHTVRLSINWSEQRSSVHTFLSLDQAVPQHFFILSLAKSQ